MGTGHFKTKTLKRVSTEMDLHVLAYNLTRTINILGVKTDSPNSTWFKKLQPLRLRQGLNLFAALKFVLFLGKTSTSRVIRQNYAVQTVFHGAIEHHCSVFDTHRLWGKGRLCFLYAKFIGH